MCDRRRNSEVIGRGRKVDIYLFKLHMFSITAVSRFAILGWLKLKLKISIGRSI